jgi:DNA-binding transcriptional LysR family regulator
VQSLREGDIDIGVVMDGVPLEGLECFEYGRDRLVAVLPGRHPLRARRVAFAKVLEYDLVGLESSTVIMRQLADAALSVGEPLRLRMQVKSFEAVCKLVQAGLGIGILPEEAARDFSTRMSLRIAQLSDEWAHRLMFVCVRDRAGLPAATRALVENLVGDDALRNSRRRD